VINLSQLNFNHWFSSNGSQLLLRGCNRKSILDVGPYWYHYKSLTNDDHKKHKHKHNPPQPPFILILPSTLFPTLSSLLSAPFLSLSLSLSPSRKLQSQSCHLCKLTKHETSSSTKPYPPKKHKRHHHHKKQQNHPFKPPPPTLRIRWFLRQTPYKTRIITLNLFLFKSPSTIHKTNNNNKETIFTHTLIPQHLNFPNHNPNVQLAHHSFYTLFHFHLPFSRP
jgi:hypothetical protein